MFTGIIETQGIIANIEQEGSNVHFTIESPLSQELKIDQSVAHNGVCLTVTSCTNEQYTVTAIEETLNKTNLNTWNIGTAVNLERAMIMGARLDGHIVQGHVDSTAVCVHLVQKEGSTEFTFEYPAQFRSLVIEKGSICINGISLTAYNCTGNQVTVAIIPYTLEHTNLQRLEVGNLVNIEYDLIGKYINRQRDILLV